MCRLKAHRVWHHVYVSRRQGEGDQGSDVPLMLWNAPVPENTDSDSAAQHPCIRYYISPRYICRAL
jgi:hypothetical protein